MEQENKPHEESSVKSDIRAIVRGAIEEFLRIEQTKNEPAYKLELVEERKRREQLERKVNELAEENRRSRIAAEELERSSTIRSELQRLGVAKVDLAYKAVKDDIIRTDDGSLIAKTESGEVPMRTYLSTFVTENPELLPSRIQGGSGAGRGHSQPLTPSGGIELDKIRPGMSAEDLEKVRREIARVAKQTIRGM
jgi:hypothetical protein